MSATLPTALHEYHSLFCTSPIQWISVFFITLPQTNQCSLVSSLNLWLTQNYYSSTVYFCRIFHKNSKIPSTDPMCDLKAKLLKIISHFFSCAFHCMSLQLYMCTANASQGREEKRMCWGCSGSWDVFVFITEQVYLHVFTGSNTRQQHTENYLNLPQI